MRCLQAAGTAPFFADAIGRTANLLRGVRVVHANSTQRDQQECSLLIPHFPPICDAKACAPRIQEKRQHDGSDRTSVTNGHDGQVAEVREKVLARGAFMTRGQTPAWRFSGAGTRHSRSRSRGRSRPPNPTRSGFALIWTHVPNRHRPD